MDSPSVQGSGRSPKAIALYLVVAFGWIWLVGGALFALGEELGWRGFLHVRLGSASRFWTRSVLVGLLWGLWHAPIILQGHNYPEHPVAGVPMMIVFCVLLAPLLEHVRERSGSVVAAAVMHGTLNAPAGLAVLLVRGGDDLLVGTTGLSGFLVLLAADLSLALLRTRRPAPPGP